MADGHFRFPEGAGHPYLAQSALSNGAFRAQDRRHFSPAHNPGFTFGDDKDPAYPISPGRNSPPHQFGMFGQNHHQQGGHNPFVNGGHTQQNHRFGLPLNAAKYQNGPQHGPGHPQRPQQDGLGQAQQANYVGHQHNTSASGFNTGTPHFTPSQLRNGTPGNLQNGINRPHGEHWNRQVQAAEQAGRAVEKAHWWARLLNEKKIAPPASSDGAKKDSDQEERHRATNGTELTVSQWDSMDMSGVGLRSLTPSAFLYPFLKKLYLNNNKISFLPPAIATLRALVHFDISHNDLQVLPPEIGLLVNLKELWLFSNHLEMLPDEIGSLHQLELLGIEDNPLSDEVKSMVFEEGTKAYITALRETANAPNPPNDRQLHTISEKPSTASDTFSVMSYNTLCDKYATQNQYGYASSHALEWGHRKHTILAELVGRNADIICLQEIDVMSFNDFFKVELSYRGYRGLFYPKTRAKTMADRETKSVDGCATFYKSDKYILLDKQQVEFTSLAISRPDMKGDKDVYNRVMPRDDIALVAFLEERESGSRLIVGNAHIFWNPVFKDVKVVQAAILLEEVQKYAEQWDSTGPPARKRSPTGTRKPTRMKFQRFKIRQSTMALYLETTQTLQTINMAIILGKEYPHPFSLKSAYGTIGELSFTNYTPGFTGVIDYIWYSTNALQVTELLGDVDDEYLRRVPGFPNAHFPSDHLALLASFAVKRKKGVGSRMLESGAKDDKAG